MRYDVMIEPMKIVIQSHSIRKKEKEKGRERRKEQCKLPGEDYLFMMRIDNSIGEKATQAAVHVRKKW